MPLFVLHRDSALSAAEIDRLPAGCAVAEGAGAVARAEVEGNLAQLIAHAVAMARAVPDAELEIVVPASSARVSPRVANGAPAEAALNPATSQAAPPAEAPPSADAPLPDDSQGEEDLDPWTLISANRIAEAEKIFANGYVIDPPSRERILALSRHPDASKVALAVRIARLVPYRTFVMNVRQLADHADANVRLEVARALGVLGGRSLLLPLEKMAKDKNAEVRKAALESITAIESR